MLLIIFLGEKDACISCEIGRLLTLAFRDATMTATRHSGRCSQSQHHGILCPATQTGNHAVTTTQAQTDTADAYARCGGAFKL